MKTLFSCSIAACFAILTLFTSCKKDVNSPGGSKDNTIMGTVYDANGNKFNIPGASVVVNAFGDPGSIGDPPYNYNLQMDGNSHYEGKVESGLYKLHGRAYMQLNGKTVCVDLAPTDGKPYDVEQASKPGI